MNFAFGLNNYNGCDCPAVKAGCTYRDISGDEIAEGFVELYDEVIREELTENYGLVTEEQARQAWIEALWVRMDIDYRNHGEIRRDNDTEKHVEVAKRLGWL